MRSRAMRRRMHRVLWKKLSRIYAVDMAEVLGWIEYISIMGIFQCFCIVMVCEQRGRDSFWRRVFDSSGGDTCKNVDSRNDTECEWRSGDAG